MADKTGIVQALLDTGYGQPGGGRPSGNMTVPYLAIVRYQMLGTLTAGLTPIVWQVTGNPDRTGILCPGHVPADFVAGSICWTAVQYKAV